MWVSWQCLLWLVGGTTGIAVHSGVVSFDCQEVDDTV